MGQGPGEGMEQRMKFAVVQACRALRKRHRVEEGAHGPALAALARAVSYQGAELHVKVEELQQELAQSYRAQAQVSGQLVAEVTANQNLRSLLAEKESLVGQLHAEVTELRTRTTELEMKIDEKDKALDVVLQERTALQVLSEELAAKLLKVEVDNKMLVDRWMEQKMKDANGLNEANAIFVDMMEKMNSARLGDMAGQLEDGIVRIAEPGDEPYGIPRRLRNTINAHESGGTCLTFEHNSGVVFSGGNDSLVRQWDTLSGTPLTIYRGSVGSVLDMAISMDNNSILAACSDHKLHLWDASTGRMKHTFTGHIDRVVAVDMSPTGSKRAVSASQDRTIKIWDLTTGYVQSTIMCYSNCNSVCVTFDGSVICSGHNDGNLRFWDFRSGKLGSEMVFGSAITSVSLSRTGHTVLTSGRDNAHNILDVRTLEIRGTYRSSSYRAATNWSRSCLSPDENYVVAGSSDGTVIVWSRMSNESETCLKGGHSQPVLACAWSEMGKPLVTADKTGKICLWE